MLQTVWGWQPALYLFLGGMGSGTFVTAAILYLKDKSHYRKIICLSMWAAVACLVVGLLLLLSELTNPLRGMMMWQSFSHVSSWMTIGAWGLAAAVAVFGVSALLATFRWRGQAPRGEVESVQASGEGFVAQEKNRFESLDGRISSALSVLSVIGIALGIFVAVYTGILLMSAPGVPLWNTAVIPCLFLVSGLDTGVALVELISVGCTKSEKLEKKDHRGLLTATSGLILVELAVLTVFFVSASSSGSGSITGATAAESASLFISGILAPYFWTLVVVVGLVFPLVVAIAGLTAERREGRSLPLALSACGAICVLVGGCELRFLILAGGAHADIMLNTLAALVS